MTLFFYVLREFFRYVIGTIFLCTFLFVLFDFIHKSTKYLGKYEPETNHLVRFYLFQIPNLFIQALPIASLLAAVICMVLLSRSNEITAMRAAGMGPLRIGAPIATGGMILSLISVVVGEWVLPRSSRQVHYIQKVLIEKGDENQLVEGLQWVRDGRVLYNFREYNSGTRTLEGVKIIQTGKSFRPKRSIIAASAEYRPKNSDWLMKKVRILYFWPNGTLSYSEKRERYVVRIPIEPKKFMKERRLASEMSMAELQALIDRSEDSGADVLSTTVDMHVKFAFHFASFVVSLIGLKFGYRSERSMETARGILLAIAIGVSYWFILNAGRALGKRGTLNPLVAAWLGNVSIFVISMISIYRTRRTS